MKTFMSRRKMLAALAAASPIASAVPSVLGVTPGPTADSKAPGTDTNASSSKRAQSLRLGVCAYSYNIHWKAARDGSSTVRFTDTIEFLDYCHQLGASGVQVSVGSKE